MVPVCKTTDLRKRSIPLSCIIQNVAGIYGLSVNTLQALSRIDLLLHKTQILTEQPRLDPWLARVLVTELLWRNKCLKSRSKPVLTILAYESKLREEFKSFERIETTIVRTEKVQRPRYVRVNTLLLSVEEAISNFQEEGWRLLPKSITYSSYLQSLSRLSKPYFIQDLHVPEVLVFPSSTLFHQHSGYQNGKLILQDKASCLPAHLLNPVSGSVVLDMCAAPGMKTTHMAAKLQNYGKIYAVEIDAMRFETLCGQIKKTCSFCVELVNQDALTLNPERYSDVEYILVDPTCSGSGIVDRPKQSNMDDKPEAERLQNLQSFQVYLLRYALFNFPNAKKIIYSTCSLYPEENEKVIDEVLADIGNAYHLVPIRQLLKNNWTNFSSKEYKCSDTCLYSKPNDDYCNGFFIAIFERNFDVILPKCKLKGGNEYRNLKADLNVEKNNTAKPVAHKRKKHGEKKKDEISIDEHITNVSTDIVEFVPEIKSKVKIEKNNKETKTIDVCNDLSNINHKEMLNESEDILRKRASENMKIKKSKKRRLKHENILQIEEDEEMMEIDHVGKQINEEIANQMPKRKRKEKRKNEKVTKIDEMYVREVEQDSEIEPSKKKKKHKEKY
ncbi:probable 28S rRNA (cytosine-C(5))-methyltransferase [Pogonomyrmex barbatus]|uniref:Probable 28S rRNA (Cytosine-C(5))-methyltransferase n=1 Tax=Pogonomyrmex barbatus TaxID=144034 RepID=A0A6I9WMK0_9HYME|nr:probable 28S rRNA (cytosine-C(5))-methyltransferase [Pogonomyrmex barbatus]